MVVKADTLGWSHIVEGQTAHQSLVVFDLQQKDREGALSRHTATPQQHKLHLLTFTSCFNRLHKRFASTELVLRYDADSVGGVGSQPPTDEAGGCLIQGLSLGILWADYTVASQRTNGAGGRSPL